ncbi:MAG: hypothetical protein OYH77_02415, partial [Pseudomonadota bacterium]|nr:hypothetical protein [Pseudomonadota bacterium]
MIDKSVIQALNPDKARELADTYSIVLPHILIEEMTSMLAKEKKGNKDPENILKKIARKSMNGSLVVPHARLLAKKNLLGEEIPMDGRIILMGGELIRRRDGGFGTYYDTTKDKKCLLDWSRGEFASYRNKASDIRNREHAFDYKYYHRVSSDVFNRLPQFKTMDDFTKWFYDPHLANMSPEQLFSLATQDLLNENETVKAKEGWKNSGKTIQDCFPYAFHYARVNHWFFGLIGMACIPGLVSKKAKLHLDMQYLYYLPFCKIFTTCDNLLLDMATFFRMPGQNIISGEEVKKDLAKVCKIKGSSNSSKVSSEVIKELSGGEVLQDWQSIQLSRQTAESNKHDENLTKRFGEDILVNSDMPESFIKRKREKSSIYKRCKSFADETLKIVGYYKHRNWDDLKENFTSDTVKQIYDLHADVWHPSDPFKELASDLIDKKFQRFLYLGDIEPNDVLEQIFRWSLYLDQILIPDPFLSPWATNKQFNPIANSDQAKLEALKLVYFLILLSPLLHTGQVVIVPNPTEFNHKVKDRIFEILNAGTGNQNALIGDRDVKQTTERFLLDLLRIYARLPNNEMLQVLESICGKISKDATLELAEYVRKNDLFYLSNGKPSSQMIYTGRSVGFEEALLLSALYGAVPMPSYLEARKKQFLLESDESEHISTLNKYLSELKIIEMCDPYSSTRLKEHGIAANFRYLIRDFVACSSEVSSRRIECVFKEHDK